MYSTSSVYAVNHAATCLTAQSSSTEEHRFFVGTSALHEDNEVSLLQYIEDSNHLESLLVFNHVDQVLALETSPHYPDHLLTSRMNSKTGVKSQTLWKLPSLSDANFLSSHSTQDLVELEDTVTFNVSSKASQVRSMKWHRKEQEQILTADNKVVTLWRLSDGDMKQMNAVALTHQDETANANDLSVYPQPAAIAWDPHHHNVFASGYGSRLQLVDCREMDTTAQHLQAHNGCIRDLDFNPNKANMLISAGDDRKVKFWDLRKLDKPVLFLTGHSHNILSAKYNPYHDQLVLTGGSDNLVNLWRVASCSSSPWLGGGSSSGHHDGTPDEAANVKVKAIDQHEDSVYSVAWSPADAWIFSSLSYDGRVIINHVPSTEKYKILL